MTILTATQEMTRGEVTVPDAHRLAELVAKRNVDVASYAAEFDRLIKLNDGERALSTFEDGAKYWLDRADRSGDGDVTPLGASGLHMVAMSRQQVQLRWPGVLLPGSSSALHLLIDLSSNIDHNLYLTIDRDKRRSLRISNTSITWVETASVIHLEGRIAAITLFRDATSTSIYINGELKLYKKAAGGVGDRVEIALLPHESADLGAGILGLEIWNLRSDLRGFGRNPRHTLQTKLRGLVERGDLGAVCSFLDTFDDVDIAPLTGGLVGLLDQSLKVTKGFPDWGVDRVLLALPVEIANDWLRRRKAEMPQPSVRVENLSITLFRNPAKKWSLRNLIRRRRPETFQAVSHVTFNVYPGDIFGIIGANGAGKSTLLKAINGLVPINGGIISLYAKPLLLSPGLGIRDELSGADNIRLACCFMGMSAREADVLFPDIVAFSELGESIHQPYKFYSDGMKSRLVFSIATSVAPDIIMLDELLNAGDIGFQQKAARRMEETINRAKAVIIVTHSVPFVLNRCNKALLLHHGEQIVYGSPAEAVSRYLDILRIGDLRSTTEVIVASG